MSNYIKATNTKTGENLLFKDNGSNLHIFQQRFDPLTWKTEFVSEPCNCGEWRFRNPNSQPYWFCFTLMKELPV